ncbi:hypothetical protein DFH08DRAFT_819776 [Mycena albidolilacea]|uniref:Uncharacterized protein n=1 Tax=Mycena albidolilacea TaxID=1033008 RepID=A0AAD6ZDC1_9AGAR|nr:hypothetical protein DFH08DRAFT_819776 [Mycena albidolilacea]
MTVLQAGWQRRCLQRSRHVPSLPSRLRSEVRTEPFICLGSFVGSKDDGDVPPWTSILKPGQTHYFLETTAFAATVTDIKVESVSSAGTQVEADVAAHCDQLKRKESERQGDGMYNLATRGSSMHNLKMIPMMVPLTTPVPPPIFMALLTDSSSVNLPPDTIENFSPDVSDMNRPIANSKDVIALEVQAVESVDGTMNASRHPRLVRRVAPTSFEIDSPPHSPTSSKRKPVDDEEFRDLKRQKLGLGESSSASGKENVPPTFVAL